MAYTTITGWQCHILAGWQYLITAHNGLTRPSVFSNELIFQLTSMAIENLLVGMWQYHCQMPTDHTLCGLVDGMALFCPLDRDLAESIKQLDENDNMCALAPVQRRAPNGTEIQGVLAVGRGVADYVKQHVPWIRTNETTAWKESVFDRRQEGGRKTCNH